MKLLSTICVLIVAVACVWLYKLNKTRANDPYGLFHLSLNKRRGEDERSPPKTEWLNMGYWRDTNIFPDACQALALKLIQVAQCKENGKVLDVGHGTGESLILLLTHPAVPRPSLLTGITSLPLHHQRSLRRTQQIAPPGTKVLLHVGDVIYRDSSPADHPLNPSSSPKFDTILALDCAFHFQTREKFLRQSFHCLEPGGRIALADICFSNTLPMSWRARLVRKFLRLIPRENAVSIDEYRKCLQRAGFEDITIEDISSDVFPGFASFLKPRGFWWWLSGSVFQYYYMSGARFVLASGSRSK